MSKSKKPRQKPPDKKRVDDKKLLKNLSIINSIFRLIKTAVEIINMLK